MAVEESYNAAIPTCCLPLHTIDFTIFMKEKIINIVSMSKIQVYITYHIWSHIFYVTINQQPWCRCHPTLVLQNFWARITRPQWMLYNIYTNSQQLIMEKHKTPPHTHEKTIYKASELIALLFSFTPFLYSKLFHRPHLRTHTRATQAPTAETKNQRRDWASSLPLSGGVTNHQVGQRIWFYTTTVPENEILLVNVGTMQNLRRMKYCKRSI